MKISDLIDQAKNVARDYQPSEWCSSGSVGAALVTKAGNVYTGVCIDCACGIGFCAEHAAVAEMLKHKESEIETIVAVNSRGDILPPCGRCRELINQVNDTNIGTKIVLSGKKVVTLKELLPYRWQATDPT